MGVSLISRTLVFQTSSVDYTRNFTESWGITIDLERPISKNFAWMIGGTYILPLEYIMPYDTNDKYYYKDEVAYFDVFANLMYYPIKASKDFFIMTGIKVGKDLFKVAEAKDFGAGVQLGLGYKFKKKFLIQLTQDYFYSYVTIKDQKYFTKDIQARLGLKYLL